MLIQIDFADSVHNKVKGRKKFIVFSFVKFYAKNDNLQT